jgi:cytoskeletal protein CcmA (bactofilin family)
MKEKRREMDDTKITGFFDKDTRIKGDLSFKGSFRIDGHFKGNIKSDSVLIIGPNGEVEADMQIGHVIVDGRIKGNIHAKEKAEIHATGRVIGTITAPKLMIEEGAFLEASCQTSDKLPQASAEKPHAEPEKLPAKQESGGPGKDS